MHSRFMQQGPFTPPSVSDFGMASGGPAKAADARPAHVRYRGRAPAQKDERPTMTIGTIDNINNKFSSEFQKKGGVLRDVQGVPYPTEHRARAKKEVHEKPVNDAIKMDGTSHYEPALGEMLYHLRLHNTHKTDFSGLLIVTTTLPHGSQPQHSYWIRNRRRKPGERPEQHDCVVKRLTVTCRVHKLAPGQLGTIYVHNKQRESGLGPAHSSLAVDGKVRSTTSL